VADVTAERNDVQPDGALFGPSPPQAVSVARVGNLRWAELQAFAVVGSWVSTTPEHAVGVALDGISRHAAWRAAQLADRLPVVGALAAEVVTVPRDNGLVGVVQGLAALDATAARLAALDEVVLAGLAASGSALLATLSPVADAPLLRVLPMVISDLDRDRDIVARLRADVLASELADERADEPAGTANGPAGSDARSLGAALADAGGW
jgi:hypothetical protein